MATYEDALQILQVKDGENSSVIEHVAAVVLKILQEQPNQATGMFEELSIQVKAKKTSAAPKPLDTISPNAVEFAKKASQLVTSLNSAPSDAVQNLSKDTELLDWGGISLGKEESFYIHCKMIELYSNMMDSDDPINKVRFWGKLLGCKGLDYYVFECECDSSVENDGIKMEGREGANKYTYYVLQNDGSVTVLPHVTEEQIKCARQVKRFLTGNLNVSVAAYPAFPGSEANFVRAIISLISSDTAVAPVSFFGASDAEDSVAIVSKVGDEESPAEALTSENASDLSSWTHFENCIDSMGRMTVAPMVTNEEGEEVMDPIYESATKAREDPLAALADEEGGWKSIQLPSTGVTQVGVVKSLKWPGAVAVAPVGEVRFVNCYVGYGLLSERNAYTPPILPLLQQEYGASLLEEVDIIETPIVPQDEGEDE